MRTVFKAYKVSSYGNILILCEFNLKIIGYMGHMLNLHHAVKIAHPCVYRLSYAD